VEAFPSILQPPVKLFLKAVQRFSQQKVSFTACKSSFTRPVKPTGSPPVVELIWGEISQCLNTIIFVCDIQEPVTTDFQIQQVEPMLSN
jgi:hypothetical protein